MIEIKNEKNGEAVLRAYYREVLLDILANGPGYFIGKYDAENSNVHYMNGIDTVIEYLISKSFDDNESLDHVYGIINENKRKSLEKANLNRKHYNIFTRYLGEENDVYQTSFDYNRVIREKLYNINSIVIIDDRDELDNMINYDNFDLVIKRLSRNNNQDKKKAKFLVVQNKNHLDEDEIALMLDMKFMLAKGFEYERKDRNLIITIPIY